MRSYLALLGVLAVLGGCGDRPQVDSALIGNWTDKTSDTHWITLSFSANGTYTANVVEIVPGVNKQVEAETGTFTTADSIVYFVPKTHTCSGPYPAYDILYQFGLDDLFIGGLTFAPNSVPASGDLWVVLGCFDANHLFTPGPTNQL